MSVELLRIGVALFALIVVAYWTFQRARGGSEDPTLRMSKASESGSTSILISGWYAVVAVAGVMTLALWPEIEATPELGLVPLAFVSAHFIVEARER